MRGCFVRVQQKSKYLDSMKIALGELRVMIRESLLAERVSVGDLVSHINPRSDKNHRAVVLDSDGHEVLALFLTSRPGWQGNSVRAPEWLLKKMHFSPQKATYLAPDKRPVSEFKPMGGRILTEPEVDQLRDTFFPRYDDE